MMLGAQLRKLREDRGISAEHAGYTIRASHSKISRMETGRVGFKERDVADLLTLYGVVDPGERDTMLELVARANEPGWWHNYNDLLPSWFEIYMGLEGAASLIRTYELQFVPGLLQTEGYARALIPLGYPEITGDELERRVQLRMRRQTRLHAADLRVWAIVDENALRRPIGGKAVMREQVEHLIELSTRPNVTIQVLPFNAGGHAGVSGAFSLLRFPEETLPDIVYLEQLTSALYLDKPADIDRYLQVMNRLALEAAQPEDSRDMLMRVLTNRTA
ncbi:helix-turn-helix transcriptional regulator [Actinocorallia sp. A-T 12471]|uniref:helix-turn-helix domain-containing protein n=1 Tax=Actinocorallia sp. A-T 12471 TaxID=3089813 RepID=UPI0029CCED46|nr:helix-turn-helix transcriptional regulator [Actinocorallia sp. A-T 12471]MDX6740008.1 helix-turn-helix transcriptional regulator [Actinocorallia sp. A-T 12471]